jgi:hypothetical protein
MICIDLDYYNKNQQWIESVLNGPSLVLHLKYWKFTIENMQLICQNFGCVS